MTNFLLGCIAGVILTGFAVLFLLPIDDDDRRGL